MTASTAAFLAWFRSNGGSFHSNAQFTAVPSGYSVIANQDIPTDETIVTCPFSLAITPQVALASLVKLLGQKHEEALKKWSERQIICSYLCFHEIIPRDSLEKYDLAHRFYLDILPPQKELRTSVHFVSSELEEFRGTNIYGATLDRQTTFREEAEECKITIIKVNEGWSFAFTWERYRTAATYLSSRAFPSTILSSTPTLESTPDSYPILLPGIDSLNHARATPVSWVISGQANKDADYSQNSGASISIVLHRPTPSGGEIFNSYGGKPNSELILGYGFTIPDNPEDTIVLSIGDQRYSDSSSKSKWEVGRDAKGADNVWEEVLSRIRSSPEGGDKDDGDDDDGDDDENIRPAYEDKLEASQVLAEMVQTVFDRLPPAEGGAEKATKTRPEVALMVHDYISGQRAILESLLTFACQKEAEAVEEARESGVELVFE